MLVVQQTAEAYRLKAPRPQLESEIRMLSALYSQHLLRYGTGYDIFIDPAPLSAIECCEELPL